VQRIPVAETEEVTGVRVQITSVCGVTKAATLRILEQGWV